MNDIDTAPIHFIHTYTRVAPFFSEMAILWGFLRYTTKGQKFWPYGLFKAARSKRKKKFKNQVWLKMLRIVQFSEKCKNSKNFSKSAK